MSFHWNLSSDEEDEEGLEELWKKAANDQKINNDNDDDDGDGNDYSTGGFAFELAMAAPAVASVAKLPSGFDNDIDDDVDDDGEDGDEESVNWEDADDDGMDMNNHIKTAADNEDDDDDEDENKKPASGPTIQIKKARPLQSVTIDLDSKPSAKDKETKKKKQVKTRHKYRFDSLPNNTRFLLDNLHRAHWLTLTSHVVFNSSQCSNELVLPVAFSLIPSCWTDSIIISNNNNIANEENANKTKTAPPQPRAPTVEELRIFCAWFFDLVHNAEQRRLQTLRTNVAAGAPRPAAIRTSNNGRKGRKWHAKLNTATANNLPVLQFLVNNAVSSVSRLLDYCAYLSSSQEEDAQLFGNQEQATTCWTETDKVNLFIAMARSLGWRARYAAALDPIKRDLDMDHPIFKTAMTNVFRIASSWSHSVKHGKRDSQINGGDIYPDQPKQKQNPGRQKNGGKRRPIDYLKVLQKTDSGINASNNLVFGGGTRLVGWVEILCRVDGGKTTANNSAASKHRWIHVDPQIQVVDEPQRVEALLFEQLQEETNCGQPAAKQRRTSKGTSKKLLPVTFVLAAEHCSDEYTGEQRKRITDVTPRYASSMVETLKRRGIPPKHQAKALCNQKLTWWSKAIRSLNSSFKRSSRQDTTQIIVSVSTPQTGKSEEDAIDVISDNEEKAKDQDYDAGGENDEIDTFEKQELASSSKSEALPTSKEKFKSHPLYVIQSVLKSTEVLAPDAKKRVCGFFKGEKVYSRSDVSEAIAEKKWLYKGRKVRESELKKPVKRVKRRASTGKGKGSFKALKSYGVGKENDGSTQSRQKQLELASEPLDDGMQNLYAIWQTEPWSPAYVGPGDKIPINEYNNIELELLNPGLAHIDERGISKVAKQLGIPYAPCLLGFEGHGGNRTPTIRGIVVHEHNADLLREASVEVRSKTIEDENESRRRAIYSKWKKLLVGVLTKDRLEREYG